MVQAQVIEEKFVFSHAAAELEKSFIKDGEGKRLGFSKSTSGNDLIFTTDNSGIDVAIEHCADGTRIFHMERDSKGLPAMHEFRPDGGEVIYLFDKNKRLEKMVEMKENGDKLTTWFSIKGETISQEQRQQGGIVFSMRAKGDFAMIWLKNDGTIEAHGNHKLSAHLKLVFAKFLDGIDG